LFKRNKKIRAIQKLNTTDPLISVDILLKRIEEIDLSIAETTRSIFEAQIVRFRSLFSNNVNILENFQRKLVEKSVNNSLLWHQKRLRELNSERILLQDDLDKISGKYWNKRLKRIIQRIIIWLCILLSIFVFIIGIATAIYLIPFFIFILSSVLIFKILKDSRFKKRM
tara:strand:- start:978 stop:1484 length:507 start_codon:yes stop_codon:yes gene_type:complete